MLYIFIITNDVIDLSYTKEGSRVPTWKVMVEEDGVGEIVSWKNDAIKQDNPPLTFNIVCYLVVLECYNDHSLKIGQI